MLVKQSLGLEDAKTIGDAALACARSKGLAVAIAVVGEATYLQYFVTAPATGPARVQSRKHVLPPKVDIRPLFSKSRSMPAGFRW